jgi:hypothetical protein
VTRLRHVRARFPGDPTILGLVTLRWDREMHPDVKKALQEAERRAMQDVEDSQRGAGLDQ